MASHFFVGTRKGLFGERTGRAGDCGAVSFLGDHVPMLVADPRDGALYAAIEHGHFGTKLHRSDDGGATWAEVAPRPTPSRGPRRSTSTRPRGAGPPLEAREDLGTRAAATPSRA